MNNQEKFFNIGKILTSSKMASSDVTENSMISENTKSFHPESIQTYRINNRCIPPPTKDEYNRSVIVNNHPTTEPGCAILKNILEKKNTIYVSKTTKKFNKL